MTDMSTISDKSNTSAERVKPDVALDGMMASFMEGFGCAAEAIHEGNNVHPKSWVNYWPNSQAHADWFAAVTTPALTPDALAPIPAGEVAVDLRTLVPGFRLDWSGLRNRFEEDLGRAQLLSTYEMRAAHLDEMAREFEQAVMTAADLLSRMAGERAK